MKPQKKELLEALVIFAIIAATAYMAVRALLLFYSNYTGLEKFLALLLIIGELFVLIHGFGYMVNILRARNRKEEEFSLKMPLGEEPAVAIFVAARHEPKSVLENTFITLKNLNYRNKAVYFLDDSTEEKYKKEAQELSDELGLVLFRRKERHGAKAGIVNDCLKSLNHKYVAIFDADQNPLPEFLNVLVPILEKNPRLAFIQTPQFYTNIEESRVARAAGFQQAVFYEYICEGKSTGGAMFCCGTNVVFRVDALREAGGLDESTVTEDFATSVKLHANGWKSLYFNHVYAFGMGPEDLNSYFKQQFRWANGAISVLKQVIWRFITRPFSLKAGQWWEYFLSGSYYLVGVGFFFMMICPVIYLLFGVPSFFMKKELYLFAFIPYIIFSMSVFYFALKGRNYKVKDLFLGQLLGMAAITVYMRAAAGAVLGVKTAFGVTGKGKGKALSYFRLWPQLSLWLLNFVAVAWGLNRFAYEREAAVIVNSFWASYHFAVMSAVFYFNQLSE